MNNMNVPGAAPVLMTNTLVHLDVSDTDGDDIPAYWELEHFGGTTNSAATGMYRAEAKLPGTP